MSSNEQQLKVALQTLLQSNYDADSKTCIVTLMKILDNVIQKPNNPKTRTIRMGNPNFHEKVVQRKGGVDYLLACGFVVENSAPALLSTDQTGESYLILHPSAESTSHLITARRLLAQTATLELHMKADELPKYVAPPVVSQSSSTTTASSQQQQSSSSSFDIYKGHRHDGVSAVLGQNLGPDSNYVSTTETQLNLLQQKQQKLEQKLQKPLQDRELKVVLLMNDSSKQPATTTIMMNDDSPSDAALLAQRLQRQHQERLQREEGGFTTKAMRDLQAMKKSKVYTYVQLRIQFSDGSVLSAKFLPKERIQTVKQVILENCCFENLDLDLYVAPPRRMLDLGKTLEEEGLVPAARVIASWKVGCSPPNNTSSSQSGSFWKPELLLQQSSNVETSFPEAKPVVEQKSSAANTDGSTNSREEEMMRRMMGAEKKLGSSSSSSKTAAANKKGGGKPKWFKG